MKMINKLKNLSLNDKIIAKNIIYTFLVKGGGLAISFLSAPAFINYFGGDKVILGLWFTLLSVLIWFMNFDLGIGNGIRNHLVKAFASNNREEARLIISSGMFSIGIVTLLLSFIGYILISSIDLNWLFNLEQETVSKVNLLFAARMVFLSIMLSFFLTIVSSVFYSLQKSAVNSFLGLCISLLQLTFILCFRFEDPEAALRNISICYLVVMNLPKIIAGLYIFNKNLKDCKPSFKLIKRETINKIMVIGVMFFLCQLAYMFIANTNEFFITKYFGSQFTTEYSFYYKLTFLISMMVSLGLTPIWSMVTKATAENDYQWLSKLFNRLKKIGIIAVILQFSIIPLLQFLMDIWLGKNFIVVNYNIAFSFACFGSVFIYSSILSTIVCGMSRMKLQFYCYLIGIIIKFLVIDFFANTYVDWSIVVWSNVLILLPYCILQQIDIERLLKRSITQ